MVLVHHTPMEPEGSLTDGIRQTWNWNRSAGTVSPACLCIRFPVVVGLDIVPRAHLHADFEKLADSAICGR